MADQTILIVDDEVMLVDMLTLRLEASGYNVEAAFDGFEGLNKAAAIMPSLIVLDIGMEKMDGYTMLKKLREDDKIGKIKVIMLTASGKARDKFEKLGISDFITKPFDTEDFLRRVKKALAK